MLIVGNGRLITRDPARPFPERGGVAIEGDSILEIAAAQELRRKYPDAEWLDAHGGLILPGLVNVHHHIYSALARGLTIRGDHPKNFMDILAGRWWPLDRALTLEDVRCSALATLVDCVKNGVTTVFDHHASYGAIEGSLSEIAHAAQTVGIRVNLCYEVSDRNGAEAMRRAVAENLDWIRRARAEDSGMFAAMMGLHASFTLSDETLAFVREQTPAETGFHIHVAEGMDDVYDSLRRHGRRVVERLFDFDLLGPKTLAVHGVHLNGHEMDLLGQTDTMLAHNPESNMGNAVGCPPTLEMLRRNLTVGLGTDGYTGDLLESYKVANLLHKHHTGDPDAAWAEIPRMLFEHNAAIANRYFAKPLGVLRVGAAADVIVADYDPLTPMDASNANSHILFGMNGRSVVSTVCNGKIRMKDRVVQMLDEAALMADCRAHAAALAERINAPDRRCQQ